MVTIGLAEYNYLMLPLFLTLLYLIFILSLPKFGGFHSLKHGKFIYFSINTSPQNCMNISREVEGWKKSPWLGDFFGDEILPSYVGIIL